MITDCYFYFVNQVTLKMFKYYVLLPVLVVVKFHCGDGDGFCKSSVEIQNIERFIRQNITLTCAHSEKCTSVTWERHTDDESVTMLTPSEHEFGRSQLLIGVHPATGYSVLSLTNVSESLAGGYSCHCKMKIDNSELFTTSTLGCFEVSTNIMSCQMQAELQGKKKVIYNGTQLSDHVETLEATVNDILTVRCLNGGNKNTNCSELDDEVIDEIILTWSHTWCEVSCATENKKITCEVKILLNVTEDGEYSPFSTRSSSNTGSASNAVTQSEELSTKFQDVSFFATSPDTTTGAPNDFIETSTSLQRKVGTYIATTEKPNKVEQPQITRKRLVSVILIIVSLFISIAMFQCLYIIILKRQSGETHASHEEWYNPVYESVSNDNVSHYIIPERNFEGVSNQQLFESTASPQYATCRSHQVCSPDVCSGGAKECEETPTFNMITYSRIKIKPNGKVVVKPNRKERAKMVIGVEDITEANAKINNNACPTNSVAVNGGSKGAILQLLDNSHIYETVRRL